MAAVTIQMIKALQERTGAGIMDCKKALIEADGDEEKAIDILREKGIAKAASKAGRTAAEGLAYIKVCEKCGRNMVIKIGPYGKFLACPGFPECRNAKQIIQETGGTCPKCGKKVVQKKSKRGRTFYGCSGYPECTFMTWNVPVEEKCPDCGCSLFQKGGKSGMLVCEKEGCGYQRSLK